MSIQGSVPFTELGSAVRTLIHCQRYRRDHQDEGGNVSTCGSNLELTEEA